MGTQALARGRALLYGASQATTSPTVYAPPKVRYDRLEGYYLGTIYGGGVPGAGTLNGHPLPKAIRAITLMPGRAIDWWAPHVYPHGRIPWDVDKTNMEAVAAFEQAMRWGGWTDNDLFTYVDREMLLGNTFAAVEISDDGQEVYPRLFHPRQVVDLALSVRRDVTMYEVAVPVKDAKGQSLTWHRRVDRETFRTWTSVGGMQASAVAEVDNPFGFCPAIWERPRASAVTDDPRVGESRLDKVLPAFDELNGLLSEPHNYIHKIAKQPIMVVTEKPSELAAALSATPPYADSLEYTQAGTAMRDVVRQTTHVIPMPLNSSAFPLLSNIGLADALAWVERMQADIRDALPELTLSKDLSGTRELGVRATVEQVEHDLNLAASGADRGIVKLLQMCCAIGGELLEQGVWPNPTGAQELFRPFNLDSYDAGDLEADTEDREVLPPTMGERALEAAQIESLTSAWALRFSGLDTEAIYGPQRAGGNGIPPETDQEYESRTQDRGILADRNQASQAITDSLSRAFSAGGPV